MGLVAGSKKIGTGTRLAAALIFTENIVGIRTCAKRFLYVLSLSLPKNNMEIAYTIVSSV